MFNLCSDVLINAFQFGTCRQLFALERVGKYFHNVINGGFIEKPFLVLSLETIFDVGSGYSYAVGCDQIISAPGSIVPQEKIKQRVFN